MYAFHATDAHIGFQIEDLRDELRRAEDAGDKAKAALIEERLIEYENEQDRRAGGAAP